MLRRTRAFTALGALGASTALVLSTMQGAASADPQAQSSDVVGVGSDTVQYAADFLFDGDTVGDVGQNFQQQNRVINEFATGDNNGRALYDSSGQLLSYYNNGSTSAVTQNGTTSIVLRAGQRPVTRPDGSGAGVGALIADSVGAAAPGNYEGLPNGSINFTRMSRLPSNGSGSEEATCDANATGCNGLHVYRFATDQLEVAVWSGSQTPTTTDPSGGTNAPALSINQLATIYGASIPNCKTWASVGVTGGASTNPIIPVIPQSGSGTRNFFIADLVAAVPTFTLGNCAVVSEEHDPTGITHAVSTNSALNTVTYPNTYPGKSYDPADAIEPFSAARITLINGQAANATFPSGVPAYFANSGEEPLDFKVKLNSGTPTDSNPLYDTTRGVYFVVRQVDVTSTVKMEPGGTKNFVQTLFSGAGSLIGSASNAALIQAAGFTPSYKDCGVDPTVAYPTC
jgi:ABC-type phosphate transport system substrate-binding protein